MQTDAPARTSPAAEAGIGAESRSTLHLWSGTIVLFGLVDLALFFVARPFHQRYFEGELGIVELPTFLVLALGAAVAFWNVVRSRGVRRRVLTILGLGAFYWGGEEVDWGQTFFRWATPEAWAKGNYQHEFNLHNEKGIVGTLVNQTPRFILVVTMVAIVLLALPFAVRWRQRLAERIGPRFMAPLPWCVAPAALALTMAIVNKSQRHLQYRGFGESQELFTALAILAYVVALSRRRDAETLPPGA